PISVRYEAVNAMLLNEFLKEHRKVEQLEKQVAALTAGLQKVSAQLELSKTAPQAVVNITKAATIDNQPPRFYRVAAFCNAAHSVEANRPTRAVSTISGADVVQ